MLIEGKEVRTVISKGSLIFRVPLERDHAEGATVRSLRENEFLQVEGEDLCVYRRDLDEENHFVCRLDLIQREVPERADGQDELQDQFYADDLDQRIQRAVEARLAAQRPVVSSGGGPMIPPLSSAQEWENSRADRQVPQLPDFERQEDERLHGDNSSPPCVRIKQEEGLSQDSLDDYFCCGTDGPAAWEQVLREMETGSLEDVGVMNQRAGVREEKWAMLDLKLLQFPKTTIYSVKRATQIQHFEAISSEPWALLVPQGPRLPKLS